MWSKEFSIYTKVMYKVGFANLNSDSKQKENNDMPYIKVRRSQTKLRFAVRPSFCARVLHFVWNCQMDLN